MQGMHVAQGDLRLSFSNTHARHRQHRFVSERPRGSSSISIRYRVLFHGSVFGASILFVVLVFFRRRIRRSLPRLLSKRLSRPIFLDGRLSPRRMGRRILE